MSNSQMVYATKYRLLIPISQKEGTYRNTGKSEEREKITDKLVPRKYVEERNAGKHHEFWVIDEKKTAELEAQREKNIAKQAIDKKRSNATMGDLIEAFAGTQSPAAVDTSELDALKAQLAKAQAENKELKKAPPAPKVEPVTESKDSDTPSVDWSLEKLKAYCDDNLIEYHPSTREKGLMKLIKEAK